MIALLDWWKSVVKSSSAVTGESGGNRLAIGSVGSRLAMVYSMDALVPGLYVWLGGWTLRLGGSAPEENYRGMVHRAIGVALVLPGYRIFSTYQGSYDPR
jgi:hypothetical protein